MIRFCDGMLEESHDVAEEIGRETGEVDERGVRGGVIRLREIVYKIVGIFAIEPRWREKGK